MFFEGKKVKTLHFQTMSSWRSLEQRMMSPHSHVFFLKNRFCNVSIPVFFFFFFWGQISYDQKFPRPKNNPPIRRRRRVQGVSIGKKNVQNQPYFEDEQVKICHFQTMSSWRSPEHVIQNISTFLSVLQPNLAHSSSGSLPVHLLNRIERKTLNPKPLIHTWQSVFFFQEFLFVANVAIIHSKQSSFLQFYDFESFAKFSKILAIIFEFSLFFKFPKNKFGHQNLRICPPKRKTLTGRCRKIDCHLQPKSGYKPNMKYKSLIILLYIFGCTLKTKYRNLVIYTIFSLTLAD